MVRRPATALAAAFACLGGLVVTWGLTFGSGRVRWLDAADARIKRLPMPLADHPQPVTARRAARRKIGARR